MLVPDRQRQVLDLVRRDGSAQVEQLADSLGVSASTVRRDLVQLEAEGLLLRTHGGAYLQRTGARPPTASSEDGNDDAKQRIGHAAAAHVHDGMTVMILAGSTTEAMLPHLTDRSVTVVTNGLEIAHTLAAFPDVDLVVLGGVLHREQRTLLGPMTEQNMANLHVDVLFAGAYGIDPEVGVTGSKVIAAGYHHSMLRHTESLVVLADASKFGRQGPTLLAGIEQVDTFVTDTAVPTPLASAIRERGARISVH